MDYPVALHFGPSIDEYVREIIDRLPAEVRPLAVLGGGALRSFFDSTPVKDYDIFFRTHEDYLTACAAMLAAGYGESEDSIRNAPSYVVRPGVPPYNFIGFRHESPRALAESFDFTCCCMVAYLDADRPNEGITFIAVENARLHANGKELHINRVRPTKRLLKRTARYVEKYSYRITDEFVARFRESFDAIDDEGEPKDY